MSDTIKTMPAILALGPEVYRVRSFAGWAHGSQLLWDLPVLEHLDAVATLAAHFNGGAEMVTAAYLHRILRDTTVPARVLGDLFGPDVTLLVQFLVPEKAAGRDYEDARKRSLTRVRDVGGPRAVFLALCERIAIVQAARKGLVGGPYFAALAREQPLFAAHLFRDLEHESLWKFLRELLEPTQVSLSDMPRVGLS